VSALIGTTLFLLRVLTTFWGGMFEADDAHNFDAIDDHHLVPPFKFITLHSLSGFLMMFGFSGLACITQLDLSRPQAVGWAFLMGLIVMALTSVIVRGFLRLQAQGAVFSIEKTIGLVGTVYQTIPERGQGKIQVIVGGITRELLAQSHYQECIDSFSTVKIVRVIDYQTVEVIHV
jgi:hypothetical protein